MVKYKWHEMNNEDKDKLISKEVLNFDCFNSLNGLHWYEKHYSLGNWHYHTNILDAIDLTKRIITENFEVQIHISEEGCKCLITKDKDIISQGVTETLPESICIAVLMAKKVDIEV